MSNFIAFINSFLSYFMMFAISCALVFGGAVIGIRLRKSKDLKDGASGEKE